MSYPYPQDRHLDRKEKGDQPYQDAKEAFAQKEAELETKAMPERDPNDLLTEEERKELQEQQASERFRDIGEERDQS